MQIFTPSEEQTYVRNVCDGARKTADLKNNQYIYLLRVQFVYLKSKQNTYFKA
jgi:hypothetical protein